MGGDQIEARAEQADSHKTNVPTCPRMPKNRQVDLGGELAQAPDSVADQGVPREGLRGV